MKHLLLAALAFLFLNCSGSLDSPAESDDQNVKLNELLGLYKKIPAYPFQFTYEDLHTDPTEIPNELKKEFFELEENVSAQALHFYEVNEQYVLFTMWNVTPIPSNGQIHIQADVFDKKGNRISTVESLPYQTSHREYKSNPKFEIWENALNLVIEEIFYVDPEIDGPVDGLPDQLEYRSFYSESYDLTGQGYVMSAATPFWMKVPRNFFSPFVTDYLRKDGVFDHEVIETENLFELIDKTDKEHRAVFYQFEDGLIGMSSVSVNETTGETATWLRLLEIKDQSFSDRTDELIGPYYNDIIALNCSGDLWLEQGDYGTKNNFAFQKFEQGTISFYCLDADKDDATALMKLKYVDGKFVKDND